MVSVTKNKAPIACLTVFWWSLDLRSMEPCQHSKSKWEGGCVPYVSSDTSIFRLLPKWRILQALLIFCQPAGIRWQEGSDSDILWNKKGERPKPQNELRFCVHFSGNHGPKMISFPVPVHSHDMTFKDHAYIMYKLRLTLLNGNRQCRDSTCFSSVLATRSMSILSLSRSPFGGWKALKEPPLFRNTPYHRRYDQQSTVLQMGKQKPKTAHLALYGRLQNHEYNRSFWFASIPEGSWGDVICIIYCIILQIFLPEGS